MAGRSTPRRSTTAYKVPPAIEEYEQAKQQGAVGIMIFGTPQTEALNQRLEQDKIPGTSPGFGIAASADGKYYPYLFPIAANYWSQGAAAVKFANDQLGGSLKGKKIAYIFYDNPAGHEPLPIIQALAKTQGFRIADLRGAAAGCRCQLAGAGDRSAIPPRLCDRPHLR